MAKKKSRLDFYKRQIEELISIGVSIRSAWKIINSNLPECAKITYSGFFQYVKKNIKM